MNTRPNMSCQIRVVCPADVAELVSLCQEHAAYEQADYDDNGQVERLQTALFGAKPELECLVVESSQQLVGYASFMMQFSMWNAAYYM